MSTKKPGAGICCPSGLNFLKGFTVALEILPEYEFLLKTLLDRSAVFFVTGKAGTGKTTLINYLKDNIQDYAVVASTAIAALNIGGSTIHSLFGIPPQTLNTSDVGHPKKETREVLVKLKVLIVDEVSMVTPDIVDCISNTLKMVRGNKQPFGGVSVVFVGDLLQLPPVVAGQQVGDYYAYHYNSPYFYSAKILSQVDLLPIILTKVFRQKDMVFISALDCIRTGTNPSEVLPLFNTRVGVPAAPHALKLMPTNAGVQFVNDRELGRINSKLVSYKANYHGDFGTGQSKLPAPDNLQLKVGAQVLFVKNNRYGHWVNGSIGVVSELEEDELAVTMADSGDTVEVVRDKWKKVQYKYDNKTKRIETEEVGEFVQFPVTLGWAVTIHKSQGMTLDAVHIDMGAGAFCTGQTYVALSRCRTLSGISLSNKLNPSDIKVDQRVIDLYAELGFLK